MPGSAGLRGPARGTAKSPLRGIRPRPSDKTHELVRRLCSRTANETLTARTEMMAESSNASIDVDPVAVPTAGRQEKRLDAAVPKYWLNRVFTQELQP